MVLRDYQLDTIERVRQSIRAGNRSIIIQANCGAGKTIMAANIIKNALGKDRKVVFLVHYRQLAYQAMERFTDFGMGDEVGYIMAGEESHLSRPVQIISVQTYGRRLALDDIAFNTWFKQADILIYDEAHASLAPTRKEIISLYKQNAIVLGLTATPCRSDGRPLGDLYDDIVCSSGVSELIDLGFLVPMRYFGAKNYPDLANMGADVMGDYNQKVLGKRVNKPKLVGDILENWLKIAQDRPTVIFATNVKHSIKIKEVFRSKGIAIEHVDARTPTEERVDILRRFKAGDIKVVTNCNVFSEGADFPWASCVVIAKPTKSLARYIQMAGRGLRPYEGKDDCSLIDHAGVIQRHGFLEEEVEWSLDGQDKAWVKPERKSSKKLVMCKACGLVFEGSNTCPDCGTAVRTFGKKVETVEAELEEITAKKQRKMNKEMSWTQKRQFAGALTWHAQQKGYKKGWIAHAYKSHMGVWPNDKRVKNIPPIKPEGEIKNLLTYILIKKSREYKKTREA